MKIIPLYFPLIESFDSILFYFQKIGMFQRIRKLNFKYLKFQLFSRHSLKKEKKTFKIFFFFFWIAGKSKTRHDGPDISKEIYFHDYDLCIQAKCAQVGIVGLSPIRILLTGNRFLFPKVILIALNPVINSVINTILIF